MVSGGVLHVAVEGRVGTQQPLEVVLGYLGPGRASVLAEAAGALEHGLILKGQQLLDRVGGEHAPQQAGRDAGVVERAVRHKVRLRTRPPGRSLEPNLEIGVQAAHAVAQGLVGVAVGLGPQVEC